MVACSRLSALEEFFLNPDNLYTVNRVKSAISTISFYMEFFFNRSATDWTFLVLNSAQGSSLVLATLYKGVFSRSLLHLIPPPPPHPYLYHTVQHCIRQREYHTRNGVRDQGGDGYGS